MTMRRTSVAVLVAGLLMSGGACQRVPAHAQGATAYWTVLLDDQPLPAEVPPLAVSDTVLLVAARSLCQRLGAEYTQVDSHITIKTAMRTIEMDLGQSSALVNGMAMRLAAPPRREGGVVMVPVPFVPESLGARVSFDGGRRTVAIGTAGGGSSAAAGVPRRVGTTAFPGQPNGGLMPVEGGTPKEAWARQAGEAPQGRQQLLSVPLPLEQAGGGTSMGSYPTMGGSTKPGGDAGVYGVVAIPGKSLMLGGMGGGTTSASPADLPGDRTGGSGVMGLPMHMPTLPNERTSQYGLNEAAQTPNFLGVPGRLAVVRAGTYDPDDRLAPARPSESTFTRPDPALTGLVLERRADTLSSTYYVKYRVSNLGAGVLGRPVLVRLKIGGSMGVGLQIVQETLVEHLAPGESREMNWEGSSQTIAGLNSPVILGEAEILMNQGSFDAKVANNVRKVRLTY